MYSKMFKDSTVPRLHLADLAAVPHMSSPIHRSVDPRIWSIPAESLAAATSGACRRTSRTRPQRDWWSLEKKKCVKDLEIFSPENYGETRHRFVWKMFSPEMDEMFGDDPGIRINHRRRCVSFFLRHHPWSEVICSLRINLKHSNF